MTKTWSREEARAASLEYFQGDELPADTFVNKYALKRSKKEWVERTPTDMHVRLTDEFVRIESMYENPSDRSTILSAFESWEIVAQGSPMSGIGNKYQIQSLSNCFVVESPHDSYGGIMATDEQLVQIMKRRGGVGVDISTIRPKDMPTTNSAMTTDGIIPFAVRYSNTTREVAQGGRRGALLMALDCYHPQVIDFIDVKRDKKVSTGANISVKWHDEFMHAVENDSEVTLRWPVTAPVEKAAITKTVRARDVFDRFVIANWEAAEPGAFFWDRVIENSLSDLYGELYSIICANPCLTGDTQVAVADGRKLVPIKQLAEEGKDVYVYARDPSTRRPVVKLMRNPRKTGTNVKVYKVTVEGGHSFRATEDHKILTTDGDYKKVKDLVAGDSLHIMTKQNMTFEEALPGIKSTTSQKYVWMSVSDRRSRMGEHRIVWQSFNGDISKDHVIHHIDHDAQNNVIENLRCMHVDEHNALHSHRMIGDSNPMRRAQSEWSDEKWSLYHDHMSESTSGLQNGNAYSDVTNEQLFRHAVDLAKQLKCRPSQAAWNVYAEKMALPKGLVQFRLGECSSFSAWMKRAAQEAGVSTEVVGLDPRIQRTVNEAHEMGYSVRVNDGSVEVLRTCEECRKEFWVKFTRREFAFCGTSCSNMYNNRCTDVNERRTGSINDFFQRSTASRMTAQLGVYTRLRQELNREPMLKEWIDACRTTGVVHRLGTKHGFSGWNELKRSANTYNHRVVSVEQIGFEDVYNGTVDDHHNFYFGGFSETDDSGGERLIFLNNKQCGEQLLSACDACRLLALNVSMFVVDKWTPTAKFDVQRFKKTVGLATRLLDDLVDLELEAVSRIIGKIKADPEPDSIKCRELELWETVSKIGMDLRRAGLGITGLGDAIAMMGFRYGDERSIEFTEEVYRTLEVESWRMSCILAKERGPFPIFSKSIEASHPRVAFILSLDPELRKLYNAHGRRNVALTTTAPVGSVSTLTRTTSGIEPTVYTLYERNVKVSEGSDLSVDFVDELGDKWHRYTMVHPPYAEWAASTGNKLTDVEKSPYWKSTVNDIDWEASVRVQATAQKYVDSSISKTVNVPAEATPELVRNIYIMAWKLGCKGLTVYREGTRRGIYVDPTKKAAKTKNDRPKAVVESHAPKRPKELKCDIHKTTVKGEAWTVIVGLFEGRPYEVFGGLSKYVEIPKKHRAGTLVKNGKSGGVSTYNLVIKDGPDDDDLLVFKDIVNVFENPIYGAWTRTLSLSLRHGVPIQFLCEQLTKDKASDMQSFSRVIARVLKNYIKDGTEATDTLTHSRPDGGRCSEKMVYLGGCLTCVVCGASHCG